MANQVIHSLISSLNSNLTPEPVQINVMDGNTIEPMLKKMGNLVCGSVSATTVSGSVQFYIPYRPSANMYFPLLNDSAIIDGYCLVRSNGNVTMSKAGNVNIAFITG